MQESGAAVPTEVDRTREHKTWARYRRTGTSPQVFRVLRRDRCEGGRLSAAPFTVSVVGAAWIVRRLGAVLAAGSLALGVAPPAMADSSRPTADPSAPTPTAPYPGGPPQGFAPG